MCILSLCLVAFLVQMTTVSAADTWRILAVRVSFPIEDPDNETTSGNGSFNLGTVAEEQALYDTNRIYPFDAPPHDRAYFEAHLQALANYYNDVSNSQLIIEYDVYPQDPTGSYVLETPLIEYGNGRTRQEVNERITRLFRDGILTADATDGATIDFSQYRAFAVFHAGLGGEASNKLNDIPSAFLSQEDLINLADGPVPVNNGAFQVTSGMLLPEAISTEGRGGLNGTLARFFASQLGLPGLSDFENDLPAVGDWSLMDTGANNLIDAERLGLQQLPVTDIVDGPVGSTIIGFLPSRPTAWSRIKLGWIEPRVVTRNDTVQIAAPNTSSELPQAVRIPISATEYFLIENRLSRLHTENRIPQIEFSTPHNVWTSVDDYDAFLPGSGILIYHIDDTVINASTQDKHINSHPDYEVAFAQYRRGISVEEADGLEDIGNVSASRVVQSGIISFSSIEGAPEDAFFIGNNAIFGPETTPNTNSNLGYPTGITVEVLSKPGETMTVAIRFANQSGHWPITDLSPTRQSPRVIDLNGDGIKELLHSNNPGSQTISPGAWDITGAPHLVDGNPFEFMASTSPAVGNLFSIEGNEYIFHRGGQNRTAWRRDDPIHQTIDFIVNPPPFFSTPPLIASFPIAQTDIWGWSDGKVEWGNLSSASTGSVAINESIQSLAVGNIDSDADTELVAITNSGQLHIIHASDQSDQIAAFASPVVGSPALADLDRDGDDDIIVITTDGVLSIISSDGQTFASTPVQGGAYSSPVVADLDEDGFVEVLFGGDGKLWAYRFNAILQSGGALAFPLKDDAGPIEASPIIADIDNDAAPEILVGTPGGLIYGLTSEGQPLSGFPLSLPGPIITSPLIDDLDNDGTLELIAFTSNGTMQLYHLENIDPSYTGNQVIWGQLGGGPGNAGKLLQQQGEVVAPTGTALLPASRAYVYPNPIRNGDQARIRFLLTNTADVSVAVYNPLGEKVDDLVHNNPIPNTDNEIAWNVNDYASGLYICRLQATNGTQTEVRFIKAAVIK